MGPTLPGLAPRKQEPGQGVRAREWVGRDRTVPVMTFAPALPWARARTCAHAHRQRRAHRALAWAPAAQPPASTCEAVTSVWKLPGARGGGDGVPAAPC